MGAGIYFEEGENEEQIKYQTAHHELIASAKATKMAREIDENNVVGCMFAAGSVYPYSCNPNDVWEATKLDRENYFFVDRKTSQQCAERLFVMQIELITADSTNN